MPHSYVRLSAGRGNMPEAMQAMCFMAGANSIFYGDKLLTTENPDEDSDRLLMAKLDLVPLKYHADNGKATGTEVEKLPESNCGEDSCGCSH